MLSSRISKGFATANLNHVNKFYKNAAVQEFIPTGLKNFEGTHYTVLLDGRKVKTQDGFPYFLPSKILAELVAEEFNSQQVYLRTTGMPMFMLTKAAIDISQSDNLTQHSYNRLHKFSRSDTVSYREDKQDLKKIQDKGYNPFIELTEQKLGLKFSKDVGLFDSTLLNQEEGEKIIQSHMEALNPWKLVATEMTIISLKSFSLGLMCLAGHISTTEAFKLSRIEEDYQAFFFGRIPGAHDLDEAQLSQSVYTSKVLFDLS